MIDVLIGAVGKTLVTPDGETLFQFQGEAPPISYLFNEDFEGTGTPSGWSGTGDFDSTVSPLQGLQSLRCTSGQFGIPPTLAIAEVYLKMTIRFSALPASSANFIIFYDSGFSVVLSATLQSTGVLNLGSGSISETTVATIAAGTAYDLEVHYKKGSGANGQASLAFVAAGGAIPTSGTAFIGATNGSATANVEIAQLLGAGGIPNTDFDVVQGATVFIP